MKKKLMPLLLASTLVFSGAVFTPTAFNSQPAVVSAQEEVNFDQGDMSDEEYLNSIIAAFRSAEKLHSSQVDEAQLPDGSTYEQETALIHDGSVPARQSTTTVDGEESVIYYYNEGMLFDPVGFHEQLIPAMSATDAEYEGKVEELKNELGEGALVLNDQYGGEIINPFEISFPEDQTFNSTENDGTVVRGVVEDYELTEQENEILGSVLPEGTTFNVTFEVNPADETLTLLQETVFPESDESTEGISVFEEPLVTNTVYTLTDESVPALSEFDPVTYDEYLEILSGLGLDPVL